MTSYSSSGTASDSICPKGWRLPGYDDDDTYRDLLKLYSNRNKDVGVWDGPKKSYGTIMQFYPIALIQSGYLENGTRITFRDPNDPRGFYVSNFLYSFTSFYRFTFAPTYITSTGTSDRGHGFILRCLAR